MDIQAVFVVGAGQMGAGIAQVAAMGGCKVKLYDLSEEIASKSKEKIARGLARQVERGRFTQEAVDLALESITPTGVLEDAANCDLAIEAASENVEVKKELFQKLDGMMKADAILASNTSSISITTLASVTRRPERVAGMHFFNPVPVMKLVEVVKGLMTSEETAQSLRSLAEALGKVCIVCKDSPGFVVNRLLDPMLNEAAYLVMEGVASPEEIDAAMVNGLNHPMGPLALLDLIGIDVIYAIMEVFHDYTGDQKYRPCPLLRQMTEAGLLGRKSGKGFYQYD